MDLFLSSLRSLHGQISAGSYQDMQSCADENPHVVSVDEGLVMATEATCPPFLPESSSDSDLSPEPLYQVKLIPGKGLGLLASREIKAGELIATESPLIRMNLDEMGYYRLEWEVNRLMPDKRESFWKLHHTGMEELPELFEIWRKNAFSSGSNSQSIFTIISRINNSCTPNASVSWHDEDGAEGKMHLYAIMDIGKGEEITVCCTSVLHSRNARHAVLQDTWEFACRCPSCSLTGLDLLKSEQRRARASSILGTLDYKAKEMSEVFKLVKEGIQVLKEEKLYGHLFSMSWFAYQYAALHERWEDAKFWASLAYEHSKLINGSEHPSTVVAHRGMHTPQYYSTSGKSWISMMGGCVVA